jgi:hypothetical protein
VKKNRVVVWLVVGAVAVVGLCYLALATRVSPDVERYDVAVGFLRDQYRGPTVFTVTPLDDPRTLIEPFPGGYVLTVVMQTDHHELANNTKGSPTGEISVTVMVLERRSFGFLVDYTLRGFHFNRPGQSGGLHLERSGSDPRGAQPFAFCLSPFAFPIALSIASPMNVHTMFSAIEDHACNSPAYTASTTLPTTFKS